MTSDLSIIAFTLMVAHLDTNRIRKKLRFKIKVLIESKWKSPFDFPQSSKLFDSDQNKEEIQMGCLQILNDVLLLLPNLCQTDMLNQKSGSYSLQICDINNDGPEHTQLVGVEVGKRREEEANTLMYFQQ